MKTTNWRGLNVVVTGPDSSLGTELVKRLAASGAHVHGIGRRSAKELRVRGLASYWQIDLLKNLPSQAIPNATAVFHLAANRGDRRFVADNPLTTYANLIIDQHVVRWALETGVQKFIFASSATAGALKTSDRHPDNGHPDSLFGFAKRTTEVLLTELHRQGAISAVSARLFTLYGSGPMHCGVIERWISDSRSLRNLEVLGGSQLRTFVHVSDAAQALITLGNYDLREPIDIGSGDVYSIREAALLVASHAPFDVQVTFLPYNYGSLCDQVANGNFLQSVHKQQFRLRDHLTNAWSTA